MPKIAYINKNLRGDTLKVIKTANDIIKEYQADNLVLTLRQLYYQFVSRGLIKNDDKEYKRLIKIISDARLSGLTDWMAIEDRTRTLKTHYHNTDPSDAISDAIDMYKLDKWDNQPYRVEVWIEKEALLGVIHDICEELDINFFACKGNPSQSSMWQAAQRLGGYIQDGQTPIILYLGDHDPTGIDITRDIKDRLDLFIGEGYIDINRIALNYDQVQYYNPPPNPVKLKDTRSDGYIEKFGTECWELDALEPRVIQRLIRREVESFIDYDLLNETLNQEQKDIDVLTNIRDKWENLD